MKWILILMMYTSGVDQGGVAIEQVSFYTETACIEAAIKADDAWQFRKSIRVQGICIENISVREEEKLKSRNTE